MHELELFDANPDWKLLLAAYQSAQETASTWVPRITAVEDLDPTKFSSIHGKLIALGLLKFELAGKSDGMQYQLTPFGRQALIAPESRQSSFEWQNSEDAA